MRLGIRVLFISMLFLATCIISCGDLLAPKNSLIKVIPTSAYVVMETQDITQLLHETSDNEYLSRLTDLHQLEKLKTQFSKLIQKLRVHEIQLKLDDPVAFSIHKTGSKQSDLLFTSRIKASDFQLEETLKKLSNFTRVSTRTYDENLIYSIDNEGLKFYFAYVDEYLFLTKNSGLLSDAMRQVYAEHNLSDNPTFSSVYSSANQKDILNVFIHVDGLKKALSPHSNLPFTEIRNFSDWMALDMSLGDNYLLFNGISQTRDSLNSVRNYFNGQKSNKPELFEIAPANTEFLISYHFDEFKKFFRNKKTQLKRKGKLQRFKRGLANLTFKEDKLMEQIVEEFAFLMVGKKMNQENQMGIVKLRDPSSFSLLFSPSSDSLENYRDYPFYQIKSSMLFEYLFGADFRAIKRPYWTVIDKYWVFSNSKANLRLTVNEYLLDHSLETQENFQKLKENLSNESNIWMYGASLGNKSHFNQLLKEEYLPKWQKSITQLDYFEGWMLQLDNSNNYFNVNITTKLKEERAATLVQAEWTLNLDNPLSKPVQKVWNHKSKSWELLIQDDNHNLYLISSSGEILWKRSLDEAILGKVHQVDRYKNKRLQLIFNTATKIYLIDRNGNDVEQYPIALHDVAELGMSVFDYDNNRNYRLVIPTLHTLKLLDISGKKIKGWNGIKIRPKTIISPVHYNLKNKDYILTLTEKSQLVIMDRKGNPRFDINEKFKVDRNTKILLDQTGKIPHFEFIDTTGTKIEISLNGKISSSEAFKEEESFVGQFEGKDYFVEDFELKSKNSELKFDLDHQGNFELTTYQSPTKLLTAISLNNSRKVYVLDEEGEALSGFPVYGNTGLFLGRLNEDKPNLIIGSKEGTIYNYTIDLN